MQGKGLNKDDSVYGMIYLSFSLVISWHPGIYGGQDVSTGQDSQSDRGEKLRWWQWMLEDSASCCPPLVTLGPDRRPRFWQGGQVQLSVWAHAPAWLHSENQSAKLSKANPRRQRRAARGRGSCSHWESNTESQQHALLASSSIPLSINPSLHFFLLKYTCIFHGDCAFNVISA